MTTPTDHFRRRMLACVVLTGIGAGIGGAALTLLLHLLQHVAFGYSESTFLIGVQHASPARRVLMMTIGGLVVGLGWWALRSSCRVISVTAALHDPAARLPIPRTLADAVLQVVAVAFGASLGREGAPRQLGGALGGWIARQAGVTAQQRRTLLACGAGAGLAAVYNVPVGGALFTLEVLLASFALTDVISAMLTAAIATAVAWPVLSTKAAYYIPPMHVTTGLVVYAVVLGPIAGVVGAVFARLMKRARSRPPGGWRLPVATTVAFAAVGAVSMAFPALLGNGKGPTQLALDGTSTITLMLALFLLKPLVTAVCLAGGANGGLLTPSLATGAMLGAVTGGLWNHLWPGTSLGAFALVGAAALLAITQRAPLTAVLLVIEFTHSGDALLVPIVIAVSLAVLTSRREEFLPRWFARSKVAYVE